MLFENKHLECYRNIKHDSPDTVMKCYKLDTQRILKCMRTFDWTRERKFDKYEDILTAMGVIEIHNVPILDDDRKGYHYHNFRYIIWLADTDTLWFNLYNVMDAIVMNNVHCNIPFSSNISLRFLPCDTTLYRMRDGEDYSKLITPDNSLEAEVAPFIYFGSILSSLRNKKKGDDLWERATAIEVLVEMVLDNRYEIVKFYKNDASKPVDDKDDKCKPLMVNEIRKIRQLINDPDIAKRLTEYSHSPEDD